MPEDLGEAHGASARLQKARAQILQLINKVGQLDTAVAECRGVQQTKTWVGRTPPTGPPHVLSTGTRIPAHPHACVGISWLSPRSGGTGETLLLSHGALDPTSSPQLPALFP